MLKRRSWVVAFAVTLMLSMTLGVPALAHSGSGRVAPRYGSSFDTNQAPTNLKVVSRTGNTVQLSWSAVRGAKAYQVYRNGAMIATVTTATYTDTGLTQNTAYSYTIKAVDSRNRAGKASAALSATTQLVISGDVTWTAANSPYTVNGGLVIPAGAALHIESGVVVNIKSGETVAVYGYLDAGGADGSPVVFTAAKDKTRGSCGAKGFNDYFKTILVASGGSFNGDYVKITYGDVLATVQGSLTLTHSEVAYARTLGIQVDASGEFNGTGMNIHDCCEATKCRGILAKGVVNLSLSKITSCPGVGVYVDTTGSFNSTNNTISGSAHGVEVHGTANLVLTSISNCTCGLYFDTLSENGVILNMFMGNNEYGVYNNRPKDITIQAASNYWGSANGPAVYDTATSQWVGDGDRVSAGVDYSDWLTEPAN